MRILTLKNLALLAAGAGLVFLVQVPFGAIFWEAAGTAAGFDLTTALRSVTESESLVTIRNSLVLGALTVLVTTVMAAPLAWILARTPWGRSKLLDAALLIPFMTPPYIAAMGWILFMQKRGLLEQLMPAAKAVTPAFFSLAGLVLVMSLHAVPFMTTLLKNALLNVAGGMEEAAAVSGAGFGRRLAKILAPLVTGNYAIAALLVFVKTLAEYGTPSTLGRRIGFDVFTTKIHGFATTAPVDFPSAATLSLVLTVICLLFWLCQNRITARHAYALVGGRASRPWTATAASGTRIFAAGWIAVVLFLSVGVPYFSVIATSLIKLRGYGLAPGNFTIDHYVALFTETEGGVDAVVTSLALAAGVGLIAVMAGTMLVGLFRSCGVRARPVEAVAMIPEMLPSIVLTLGLMLFWNTISKTVPLYNTMGFMVLVYVVLYLPYALQYVGSSWMQMGRQLTEAAAVSGAGAFYTYRRVTLPLIFPGVLQAFIMIFIIVFRELVAASLISPPDVLVVSTFIVREFEQGSASTAMAMALVCVAISAALLVLLRTVVSRRTVA